jgi:hypothetical protein
VARSHDEGLDDVLAPPSAPTPSADVAIPRDAGTADASEPDDPSTRGRREWKDPAAPSEVNMDAAVSDRNKGRDHKLRSLGWERYGKRLREQSGDGGETSGADDKAADSDADGEEER